MANNFLTSLLGANQPPAMMQNLLGGYYDPQQAKMKALLGAIGGFGQGLASAQPGPYLTGAGVLNSATKGMSQGYQQAQDEYLQQATGAYDMAQMQEQQKRKDQEYQDEQAAKMAEQQRRMDFEAQIDADPSMSKPQKDFLKSIGPDKAAPILGQTLFPKPVDPLDRQYKEAQIQSLLGNKPSEQPASVREFEYAKQQGYQGTYEDWKKMDAASKGVSLPAELGARIGLGDSFVQNDLPSIKEGVAAGDATGPIDYAAGQLGIGKSGEINRRLLSGVDSLRRNLTGAGMGQGEAAEYVKRYLPGPFDDPASLAQKIDGLERDLAAVRNGAVNAKSGNMNAPQQGSAKTYTFNPATGELE